MKPMIMVSPDESYDPMSHRPFYLIKRSYSAAIAGAGGSPLAPVETKFFRDYAEIADGLLLTDGTLPINTGRYGCATPAGVSPFEYQCSQTRDSLDIALCTAFIEAGKPVFGIGRGMQIINTVLGGKLNPLIDAEKHPYAVKHAITTVEGSKMAECYGEKAMVSSYHKQAVVELGKGLKATAFSEDGMIEAFEHESLPVFGVQWNPESYLQADDANYQQYNGLVEPLIPDEQLAALQMKYTATKSPIPGYATDEKIERPTNNKIFNYFIELCKK